MTQHSSFRSSGARWRSENESREQLILGRSVWRGLLRADVPGHLLTVGGGVCRPGAGALVPNLLTYRGSVIVLDSGGEHYRVTARARKMMGQKVVAFDPFGIAAGPEDSSTYNPCDPYDLVAISQANDGGAVLSDGDAAEGDGLTRRRHRDRSSAFGRAVQERAVALADLLVKPRKTREAHWDDEARALLAGLIADVMFSRRGADGDLGEVRRLLTLPCYEWEQMTFTLEFSELEFVRRTASRFRQKSACEQSGVRSTAQSHTHFLDSRALAESLRSGSWSVESGRCDFSGFQWSADVSIYIILPSDIPDHYGRWVRVLLTSILRSAPAAMARDLLVLLDNPTVVRQLDLARRLFPATAGSGIRFWLFVRDLAQLQHSCGRGWRSIVANAEVIQAFGAADDETAGMLSRRACGILTPSAVLRIGEKRQLLLRRGATPVVTRRCRYDSDPEFKSLFDSRR